MTDQQSRHLLMMLNLAIASLCKIRDHFAATLPDAPKNTPMSVNPVTGRKIKERKQLH